tara:strand:- start:52 stop:294 length:243 start_codon:yes stop_codon:yes gene_type:complete
MANVMKTYEVRETLVLIHEVQAASAAEAARLIGHDTAHDSEYNPVVKVREYIPAEYADEGHQIAAPEYVRANATSVRRWA